MVRVVSFWVHHQQQGVGNIKTRSVYIWHRGMYHQLYVCVLFSARGSTYQNSEPMFKTNYISPPFSATNARSMHYAAYKQ